MFGEGGAWAGPGANPQQGLRQWVPNWAELNPTRNEHHLSLSALSCQAPFQPPSVLCCPLWALQDSWPCLSKSFC